MSGINLAPKETAIWRIVDAIRQLAQGRTNSVGTVTLRAGQTTTVVVANTCSTTSRVFLTPQTANAAAVMLTTFVTQANTLQGSFTITHANAASIDRTFGWDVRG